MEQRRAPAATSGNSTAGVAESGAGVQNTARSHTASAVAGLVAPAPCGWLLSLSECCLRSSRTAKWLLFWMCCAAAVQGLVVNGLTNVSFTTIEKRFGLKSRSTGIIAGSYDMACLFVSVPFSYLGGRPGASKPRWLGLGLIVMGLGSFVYALPHFAADPHRTNPDEDSSNECRSSGEWSSLSDFQYAFILGQVLHGLGAVPIYTLGVAFIDESVKQSLSSLYLGIFYAMAVVGPAIGYALGGQLLKVYIDAPSVDPASLGLTPSSDRWLGAWWIGFFMSGTLAILVAIPILMIPQVIPKDDGCEEVQKEPTDGAFADAGEGDALDVPTSVSAVQHIKDFKLVTLKLLKNTSFVALSVAESADGFVMAGFSTFLPKILESQFGLSASYSAILVGGMAVSAGGGGSFIGGWFIKRLKLQCRGIFKFCFTISFISLLLSLLFLVYCPDDAFAGVNVPYRVNSSSPRQLPDLDSPCNLNCSCRGVSYNPVCGANNVIYYSPCHAGCTESAFKDGEKVMGGCGCVGRSVSAGNRTDLLAALAALEPGEATLNACPSSCSYLLPWFMLALFIMLFLTFFIAIPNIAGTLRTVEAETRAFALGLQAIAFRALGTIPGPILFGVAFDNVCNLWQETCGRQGSCVAYDNFYMSRYLLAIVLVARLTTSTSFLVAWRWHVPPPGSETSKSVLPADGGSVSSPKAEAAVASTRETQGSAITRQQHGYDNIALDPT